MRTLEQIACVICLASASIGLVLGLSLIWFGFSEVVGKLVLSCAGTFVAFGGMMSVAQTIRAANSLRTIALANRHVGACPVESRDHS